MCGRFVQGLTSDEVSEFLSSVWSIPVLNYGTVETPNFNVSPSQTCSAAVASSDNSEVEVRPLVWGVPSFTPPNRQPVRPINARLETVSEKPTFRRLFDKHRCVLVADGYYEWGTSDQGPKIPYYFSRVDGLPLLLAGVWSPSKTEVDMPSFALLTTASSGVPARIHDRMPVMLLEDSAFEWIKHPINLAASPASFSYNSDNLGMFRVSKKVNSPRYNGPDLIEPEGEPEEVLFDSGS